MSDSFEEEDDDDRCESGCGEFLDQVFYVRTAKKDFDPKIPPATGEEYIQRVVWEASKCEDILVANLDNSLIKKQTIKIETDNLIETSLATPSLEWQRFQVADFSSVRQKLARHKTTKCFSPSTALVKMPGKNNEAGWYKLCFGNVNDTLENESSTTGVQPLLSILLSMNQALIEQVLEYHVQWLESKQNFSSHQGRWLYALLACLELPLMPDSCSLLRSLARECSRLRASLKSADDVAMIPLSLIICLVANYFRQIDLADA